MPTIINPYRPDTSLGDMITKVADDLFGGDRLGAAVKREQFKTLQRGNVETGNLMGAVSGSGPIDWSVAAPALIGSGYDPKDFNALELGRNAATYGATDPRTQAAQIGAGQGYTNTSGAFDTKMAEERRNNDITSGDRRYGDDRTYAASVYGHDASNARQRYEFDREPVKAMRGGEAVFVPQAGAFDEGVSPILDEKSSPAAKYNAHYDLWLQNNPGDVEGAKRWALQQAAERSNGMKISSGPDGEFSVEMGGVGGLEKTVRSGEQKSALANNRFLGLVNMAEKFTDDPTLFGVTGMARDYGQNAVQLLKNIGQMAGKESTDQLLAEAQRDIARSGVTLLPELFDPKVPAVETVWGLLTYSAASALAGQDGRSVSDKDVAMFKSIVGDPRSVFASAESVKSKLHQLRNIVQSNEATGQAALGEQPLPDRSGGPPVGTIEDGYRFKGGDPSDPASWEPAT